MSAQATKKPNANRLAIQMVVALAAGIIVGLIFMAIRENIDPSTWATINNILFQDITAEGAESAIGIFYIGGQLFVRALQVVIVPMVFTSIAMAIGTVSDARTLGRISTKTLLWFLMSTAGGLLLASVVGMIVFDMGLFSVNLDGLSTSSGSTSSNPLLVFLNIVPSNIASVFSSNTEVLAIVFLAVATGLCMNKLGFEKTTTMRRLLQELNDIVTVFLNFVVTKFAPIAIFLPDLPHLRHLRHRVHPAGGCLHGADGHPAACLPLRGLPADGLYRHPVKPEDLPAQDHGGHPLRLLHLFVGGNPADELRDLRQADGR